MRSPGIVVRGLFVAAAVSVILSGFSWWLHQRAYANAPVVRNASALVYTGPAPVSKELAKTLSSYHASDRERALFKKFTRAEEKQDRATMRTVLRTMARTYANAGEQEMAVDLNKRAVEMSRSDGKRRDAGQNLQDIADIYHKAGKPDLALSFGEQAVDEYQRIDARRELDNMLRWLSARYRTAGMYDEARATLARANAIVLTKSKEMDATAKSLAKQVRPGSKKKSDTTARDRKDERTEELDEDDEDITGGDAA